MRSVPHSSSPTAQVSTNVFYQMIGKVVGAGTTFFITLYLARLLGPHGYGDIVKVVTYVSTFFIIADFGFNAVYLSDEQKSYTLPSLFFLRTLWSFVLLFVAYFLLRFVPLGIDDGYTAAVKLGILLYAPSILFQSMITTANAVFQKYLRYDYSFYAISVGSLTGILTVYIFSITHVSPALIGAGVYLSASIGTSFLALFYMQRLEALTMTYNRVYMKKLFIVSFPVGLTLIANLIYSHADSFILTLTRSTIEVGTYGFAYRFFETILVIPTFIMNASFPLLLAAKKQSVSLLLRRYRKLSWFMIVVSIGVAIAVWASAPLLIFIRPDFAVSGNYMRILALSFPLFFLSSLVMWMLFVFHKRWELCVIYSVSMIGNIGANVYYVPTYGATASAWITIASEALVLMATYFVLWQSLRLGKKRV